jgi:hypothetical protein
LREAMCKKERQAAAAQAQAQHAQRRSGRRSLATAARCACCARQQAVQAQQRSNQGSGRLEVGLSQASGVGHRQQRSCPAATIDADTGGSLQCDQRHALAGGVIEPQHAPLLPFVAGSIKAARGKGRRGGGFVASDSHLRRGRWRQPAIVAGGAGVGCRRRRHTVMPGWRCPWDGRQLSLCTAAAPPCTAAVLSDEGCGGAPGR